VAAAGCDAAAQTSFAGDFGDSALYYHSHRPMVYEGSLSDVSSMARMRSMWVLVSSARSR
jgi:hypothetical protein